MNVEDSVCHVEALTAFTSIDLKEVNEPRISLPPQLSVLLESES